jgi:hypothetical protein
MTFTFAVANIGGIWIKKSGYEAYGRLESVVKEEEMTGGRLGTYSCAQRYSVLGNAQPMAF